jgi:hypothetical protein
VLKASNEHRVMVLHLNFTYFSFWCEFFTSCILGKFKCCCINSISSENESLNDICIRQREVQKEQQRIRELEVSSEQNRRVLKVKMDELSVMQRRLRSAGLPVTVTQTVYDFLMIVFAFLML